MAKRYKLSNDQFKRNEIYANAKKEAIDFYDAEMYKLFVENDFLDDFAFEDYHRKRRFTAWEIFKSHEIPDENEFAFKKISKNFHFHVDACYKTWKQINKENRESTAKGLKFCFYELYI